MAEQRDQHQPRKKTPVVGFQVVEEECIWMKAGVVSFRKCDQAYDCYQCPFDRGMQRTLRSAQGDAEVAKPAWVAQLTSRFQGAERPCRHALTGRIEAPKLCPLNYECHHCAYDQMLDDFDYAQLSAPPACSLASGYRVAEGYYYHMGHCWVRFEHGGRVKVGFDDFIVRLFGAQQVLNLPPLGTELKKDQVALTFSRGTHSAASLAPVSGTVLAVNHQAREHPEIPHQDPYHRGWLYMLEPERPQKNLKGLFYGTETLRWIEQESQKLLSLMGPAYERLAATGGQPVSDVFGLFPDLGWDRLAKMFLGTEKV